MARVRPGEAANPAPPTVARVRLRFAKRGRLRFLSHRDVARSFERAVRRAGVPVSHSHGFSPHPRLSWVGAAPTGSASEAEYLEIGLTRGGRARRAGRGAGRRAARTASTCSPRRPPAARRWPTGSTPAGGASNCPGSRPPRSRAALAALLARARPWWSSGSRRPGAGRSTSAPRSSTRRSSGRWQTRRRDRCLCDTDRGRAADDTRRSTRRRVGRTRRCRGSTAPGAPEGDPDGPGSARRRRCPRRSARPRPGHHPGLTSRRRRRRAPPVRATRIARRVPRDAEN